jgi:nucleotide-binding universal stress UspA family protein
MAGTRASCRAIVVAYDATRAAERALREAAALLPGRPALVLVVWKAGLAFELIALPASAIGLPPAPLDIRAALAAERSAYEGALRAAEQAAQLARELGLDAEPLVVADDPDVPVHETIVAVARERAAQAVVVGAHAHGGILGGVSRGVVRAAPCAVVVVREDVRREELAPAGRRPTPETMTIEQKTGTSNRAYNLVSVIYHALQGAETYDAFIADAQRDGDGELADFFRGVQERNREIAERAKRLLMPRLDGA